MRLQWFVAAAFGLAIGGAGSGQSVEGSPPDVAVALAIREAEAFRKADSVVVGEVVEVHPGPRIWCGPVVTRQEVDYRLVATVDGTRPSAEFRVGHLLVHGSRLVGKEPELAPERIHPGARLLLLLHGKGDRFEAADEDFGARPIDPPAAPDPDLTAILQLVIGLPQLAPYLHPEVAGRVPLAIRLPEGIAARPRLEIFGRGVRFLSARDRRDAPHLAITAYAAFGDAATVRCDYEVEGVRAEVRLARRGGAWKVEAASVAEH